MYALENTARFQVAFPVRCLRPLQISMMVPSPGAKRAISCFMYCYISVSGTLGTLPTITCMMGQRNLIAECARHYRRSVVPDYTWHCPFLPHPASNRALLPVRRQATMITTACEMSIENSNNDSFSFDHYRLFPLQSVVPRPTISKGHTARVASRCLR